MLVDLQQPVDRVTLLPIPVPLPVRTTNCYAIDTGEGFILIDAGMDTPMARDAWRTYLSHLNITRGRARYLFVTHFHPDHLGLAHWLQDELDVPVAMMAGEVQTAQHYLIESPQDARFLREFYIAQGVPEAIISEWLALDVAFKATLRLPSEWRLMNHGDTTHMGRFHLRFLEQHGHTQHQGLLYWPDHHILFTGDQVLARITPNVSLWPGHDVNPLESYIESLTQLQSLGHTLGLPAHETLIPDVSQRIQEILAHHAARNQRLLSILSETPLTGYELTHQLFTRPLDLYQERFALGETLAHVVYLERLGRVHAIHDGPVTRYALRSEDQ
jgi:glyoxylase-like metal-dependent hydrolase (beta-lactamase superfamily II)